MQKRRRSGAHDLAINGSQAEKSTWEAFRFGIFWNPRRAVKAVLLPLFGNRNQPERGNMARSAARWRPVAIALRFHRSCFVGEALLRLSAVGLGAKRVLPYYDTVLFGLLLPAGPLIAGKSRSVGYVTDATLLLR
jgi:hypothetical protein